MKRLSLALAVLFLLPATADVAGATPTPDPEDPAPGVSWKLARARAASIRDVRYDLRLSVPADMTAPIHGEETIRFRLADTVRPLVLDFQQPAERVREVRVGGRTVPYEVRNGHIVIPGRELVRGENAVTIEFIAGDGSLNRNEDYLYSLFVPDRASIAFPGFDQPNLKARFRLTLEVPSAWRAVANGAVESREVHGGRTVWRFAETRPLSTYVFAFAAGAFQVETAVRDGRTLRMFHRETDAGKVARNRDAVFDLHAAALAWLEEYTGIPYPFQKFDFVLIPAFQFGGMEHPGAVLYRADGILLDESATQSQKLGRASLIAHETAHMWFGDLVTMNWFDDVWTKEVFANFMAAKIVNPSFPEVNHELRFLLSHYPSAYGVDRTAGANPIRQPLDNLAEAASLYGAIIYNKAPIVMKHLELMVGKERFRDGLRAYLDRYRYGNATWPDLIAILDERSPEDLRAWSRVWVEEPDRPVVGTRLALDAGGRVESLELVQQDSRGRGRLWNQRLHVALAYPDTIRLLPVQLRDTVVEVTAARGLPAPDFVLANGRGIGYGRFVPDERSLGYLLEHLPKVSDPVLRSAAWLALWDGMLEGAVEPGALMALGMEMLRAEENELVVQRLTADLTRTYWRFLPAEERMHVAGELERLLRRRMEEASASTLKATFFRAYRSIAVTDTGVALLRRIWAGEEEIAGLTLSERDYSTLALELAVRGVADAEAILERQQERIQNPDRRARFAFVRPALSADPAVRDRFFRSLEDPANRRHEPWVLSALHYLHHPLRAAHARRYIRPSLDLLQEIRRTGDIFFPKRWVDATFGGHRSEAAAAVVRDFLREHPDYPPRLRAKILQAADLLFRAARVAGPPRETDGESTLE